MLGSLKRFACRVDRPFLMLLVFDWRFSLAIVPLAATLVLGLTFSLKIWKRSPAGFSPEIRVSALDMVQAWSLTRSARLAQERGDLVGAIASWRAALANDPFDEKVGVALIEACLRSGEQKQTREALEISLWFGRFLTNAQWNERSIVSAAAAQDWPRVLRLSAGPELPPVASMARAQALFWTGNYSPARKILLGDSPPTAALYRRALDCIFADVLTRPEAFRSFLSSISATPSIEELEVSLQVCYELRDIGAFQRELARLRQFTDHVLAFDVLHARLLAMLGRRRDAAEVAARLPPPASADETFRAANALVQLGFRDEASAYLLRHREKFFDSIAPWILSAQLLLEAADKDQLRYLASRLQRSTPPLKALIAAVEAYVQISPARVRELSTALLELGPEQYPALWYLAAAGQTAAGQPEVAVDLLIQMEPNHLADPDFYDRLFAAAEAKRDATLMRRVANRRFELTPSDLSSIANEAAMLTIHDENPELAVELSSRCLEAQPESPAAQVNHAAALINVSQFASADLLLGKIDERSLAPKARNQMRFIKTKRAAKLGDLAQARSLASGLDKSALYSRQREWLGELGL